MSIDEIPRIVLAADRSSAGKTTICIGLLAVLRELGYEVQPFKVALDYIDTGFHSLVAGRASRNLDGFLMSKDAILEIFARACKGADIAIVEGVRGLYEGFDYETDVGSTAQISKILQAPVILIVDARSLTRSAAALVAGYKNFDPAVNIAGVILNYIGTERHGEKAEKAIERYCGVKVVGKIPENPRIRIEMRHLGLVTAVECSKRFSAFHTVLKQIKQQVKGHVDLDAVLEIAESAPPLRTPPPRIFRATTAAAKATAKTTTANERERAEEERGTERKGKGGESVRIGVAYDEAFNFYYQDTLDLLTLAGAEIVFFSPLSDRNLPSCDALYIGGGFPEIYAAELEANEQMRRSIKEFYENNGVIYAECGGLMYLMDEIEYKGKRFDMCGVIKGEAEWTEERRIVNYVVGEIRRDCFLGKKGKRFKAHEFHRSRINLREDVEFAYRILRGEGILRKGETALDGIIKKNCLASYTHVHAVAFPKFAEDFVEFLRWRKGERAGDSPEF
ncbi:MAG: Ni-sirohydrochlorin a,c-diamide synthase [Candidatus Methanospirare jalkutatii]|nr:Ni-sirohydrochlorin a,c-diamide synthase [Candidatus Methanospirare jalkutatii]